MIEVKTMEELIDKFPMYQNVSLPEDVALILDNAYTSLLIYREQGKISDSMLEEKNVFFIEDSLSLIKYFENIFYDYGLKAKV